MKRFSLIIIALSSSVTLNAQYKDAGMWLNFSVSSEVKKNLELSLATEARLDENITHLSSAFADLGAQYKINKQFFVTATYRCGSKSSGDFYDLRQRFQLGVLFKKKWNDFTFAYQPRWQASVSNNQGENDADFVTIMRNRFKIQYGGLNKTNVSTSCEFFNLTSQYRPLLWQSWRWVSEIERDITKNSSVSLGYLIQRNILSSPQEVDYVFLLSFQQKLNNKKKKDKEEKKN